MAGRQENSIFVSLSYKALKKETYSSKQMKEDYSKLRRIKDV